MSATTTVRPILESGDRLTRDEFHRRYCARPDLKRVRHQIGVMSRIASSFLIPDNHIGRATVSSIAVAH